MFSSYEDPHHQQSDRIVELISLLFSILGPPPSSSSSHPPARRSPPSRRTAVVSPAGFASLLLGASLALILCGSVTFFIGFILMPWVLGFVMFCYFMGILTNMSDFWMSVLCPIRREISSQLFSKLPINLDL